MRIGRDFLRLSALVVLLPACRQPYFPKVVAGNLGYLVVDGIIASGQESTIITLSRTQNLTDTLTAFTGETGALVSILGQNGEVFPMADQGNGRYLALELNLNFSELYQLGITTTNGKAYLSEPFPVRQTPPIDSVSWTYDSSLVHVFVNTHDPANNSRFYRWEYTETWQYQSTYFSQLIYQNGTLRKRTDSEQIYNCWTTTNSTSILVGTSENLSRDLIYNQPLFVDSLFVYYYPVDHSLILPAMSQKFVMEYSVLVSQYAITDSAYAYWQNLKMNTEELGSLFSPQPNSQLGGNIHCLTNPNEPVIGFISASTLQQNRIFINHYQLRRGTAPEPEIGCFEQLFPPDSLSYYLPYQALYSPIDSAFNVAGVFIGIDAGPTYCVD